MASFKGYSVQLIPALTAMREFVEHGFNFVSTRCDAGVFPSVESTAQHLAQNTNAGVWNPLVMGAPVLDDDTRRAAIRFFAGVGHNLAMRGRVRVTPGEPPRRIG